MCWDPDTKDCNIDRGDEHYSSPFKLCDCGTVFGDECDPVDDDLLNIRSVFVSREPRLFAMTYHQQLNLKDPKEKNEE